MNVKKEIKKLRKKIPEFECKKGCSDCCGVIFFTRWEWDQVKDKRNASCFSCPYVGEAGCDIYADRPIICRLFGVVPGMKCPYGCGPEKMLSEEEGREILIKWHSLMHK